MKAKNTKKTIALCISLLLIAIYSIPSFAQNTIAPSSKKGILEFASDNKIQFGSTTNASIQASASVDLGDITNDKDIAILVDTSSGLTKPDKENYPPFDYAMFSGDSNSDLTINGNEVNIHGSIHSNSGIKQNTYKINIDGAPLLDKDGRITKDSSGNIQYGKSTIETTNKKASIEGSSLTGNVEYVVTSELRNMPDYVENIKQAYLVSTAPAVRLCEVKAFTTNPAISISRYEDESMSDIKNKKFKGQMLDPVTGRLDNDNRNVDLSYDQNTHLYETSGSGAFKIFNKAYIFESGEESANSSLQINNGLKVSGKCFLVAEGDITINGPSVTFDPPATSSLTIYSMNGNVTVQPGNSTFNGLIYAPHGTASIKGDDVKINGSVVAKGLGSIPGKFTITYDGQIAHSIPNTEDPKETTLDDVPESIKSFVNTFYNPSSAGDKTVSTKIGVFTYSDRAYGYDNKDGTGEKFELLDVNSDKAKLDTIADGIKINTDKEKHGKCNLGDALRQAYYAFSVDKDKNIPKYIIVLSRAIPNYQTFKKGTGLYYNTDNEIAGGANSETKIVDYSKGEIEGYTNSWSETLSNDKVWTMFVNIQNCDNLDYETIDSHIEDYGKSFAKSIDKDMSGQTPIAGSAGATNHYR
ncbi:MAG TPA: hypothetical protein VF941_15395, partial [Clostridia bacterium]